MRRIVLLISMLSIVPVVLTAQDDGEFENWMKSAGATAGSLRKNLEAKNAEAAASDAKKMQDIFEQVHQYWEKKSVADAVKFSTDTRDGFKTVAQDAAASKFDEAAAAMKAASSNCGDATAFTGRSCRTDPPR